MITQAERDAIPHKLLRALATRRVSRICENVLLAAHPDDISILLEQCAVGRRIEHMIRHKDRFPGINALHIMPYNFATWINIGGVAQIRGMTLVIEQVIPAAIIAGINSKTSPRKIIDHPLLDGLKIAKAWTTNSQTTVNLRPKQKRRTLAHVLADHPQANAQGWRPAI